MQENLSNDQWVVLQEPPVPYLKFEERVCVCVHVCACEHPCTCGDM